MTPLDPRIRDDRASDWLLVLAFGAATTGLLCGLAFLATLLAAVWGGL